VATNEMVAALEAHTRNEARRNTKRALIAVFVVIPLGTLAVIGVLIAVAYVIFLMQPASP
jgi:hypothetical protein